MRLYLRSSDRRPDPPPLATDDPAVIRFGIGVWAVLWVAALVLHGTLRDHGHGWWIWTPPAGIVLGFLGLVYVRRRARRSA